ncbi:MAG TPA: sigma-70 family RNA polymerase sigma factor [Terriglobia bacterium]|nr:sigma-70 family RNA polymerase sigma factor [Terriglobia bacterium]
MGTGSPQDITELLKSWGTGDQQALEVLMPLVYNELRRLARRYLVGESAGHTLQSTALVHEAYMRLVDWRNVEWQSRAHFFGLAAQMMRRVLVDRARERQAAKRGSGSVKLALDHALEMPADDKVDLRALDQALTRLERLDPQQSRIVELRFFGGLSIEETATALGISTATVKRSWSTARAWLRRELLKGTGHDA